jgi:hypothetical protein
LQPSTVPPTAVQNQQRLTLAPALQAKFRFGDLNEGVGVSVGHPPSS